MSSSAGKKAMMTEEATAEVPQLQLPADLLAELSHRHKGPQTDFRVDGWKPSLLERVARMLGLG
ncbi:MAG TPA: hypothetical protein VK803_11475 [Steroidobacteraceae bacterium]|nr:hypothetical protein [Steroidobacteraceae bacterium]